MAPVYDESIPGSPKSITLASIATLWGKDGHPMLPDWDVIQDGGLQYKKLLVGKFMSDTYSASPMVFF